MNIIQGNYVYNPVKTKKIAIVVSDFNSTITSNLLEAALDTLIKYGIPENVISIFKVPGAIEIPFVINKLLKNNKYQGIIALGCIIKGETDHYEYVCNQVSNGIGNLNLISNIPIIFGVLTTNNTDEAMNRSGLKNGNKGSEYAISLIEMMNLMNKIDVD